MTLFLVGVIIGLLIAASNADSIRSQDSLMLAAVFVAAAYGIWHLGLGLLKLAGLL